MIARTIANTTALLALSLAALPFSGCRINPIEKPTVTVQSVTVRSISFTGIKLRVDLAVYNPNSISVPLKSADWRLALVGEQAVAGRAELSASIEAHQNSPIQVDVSIGALQAATIGSRISAGQSDYQLDGKLTFTTRVGDLSVPFSQSGQMARR